MLVYKAKNIKKNKQNYYICSQTAADKLINK